MPGNFLQVMAAGLAPRVSAQALKAVDTRGSGGWMGVIRESFAGAWQRGVVIDSERDLLAFSGVFAPITLIAGDVSKLRVKLIDENEDTEICTELKNSPYLPVLKKPNHYQNRIQFWERWIICKIIWGNVYVLKGRDERGMVTSMYILSPQRVTPLVTETGDVYYKLQADDLAGIRVNVVVPASEIIHDRMNCLWHDLVGISPLYACGQSATQGRRIQANSTKFFDNMSRPSGILTAPGMISDELAHRMKLEWDTNFSGGNVGKTAILGDGLHYEAMTIPAQQAQLSEQLNWTVGDVARTLHVPMYKLGGPIPGGSSVEALQQTYYNDCLHRYIEAAELCLDEGLGLRKTTETKTYYTEFDIENLLRMDNAAQLDALGKAVGAAIMSPDEARAKRNLPAVPGGKYPYLQQQYWNLGQLSKRTAAPDGIPITPAPPAPEREPAANDEEQDNLEAAALIGRITKGLLCASPSSN